MGSRRAPASRTVIARLRARAVPLAAILLLAMAIVPASAATPEPDPFPTIETWLDRPVDDTAYVSSDGSRLLVGATFWDVRNHELWAMDGLRFKLYPAKGKGQPREAPAMSDVPGHVTAQIQIPDGGAGRLEILTSGEECAADGSSCRKVHIPMKITGTGAPPDAPRGSLVRAQLLPITGDVVAGRPAPVAVTLTPIGLWDAEKLDLPHALQVVVNRAGGGRLGFAQLEQDPPETYQPYQGSLRIPETGEMVLSAALVGPNGTTQPIEGELGRVLVIAGGSRPDASPQAAERPSPRTSEAPADAGPAAPGDGEGGGPPWLMLGAIAVLVIGLALFLGEPLSRRLRGGDRDDARP